MTAADVDRQMSGRVLLVAKAGDVIGQRWNNGRDGQPVGHVDIIAQADMYAELHIDAAGLQSLAVRACRNKSRRACDGALTLKAVRR